MKKIVYFVVGLFLLSSFAAIGIHAEENTHNKTLTKNFLQPNIIQKEEYIEINIDGANNYIFSAGKPLIPIHTETRILPFGVQIKDITCEIGNTNTQTLSKKIVPSPEPMIKNQINQEKEKQINPEIYDSDEFYPKNWFSYHVGVGLDENMKRKTFLTINSYPIRYKANQDIISYSTDFKYQITYKTPDKNIFSTNTQYDMVIIAPSKFSDELQPLINHKNNYGVNTILETTEDILSTYSGYDEPEKIKYFIKDAIEEWGVKYVMLVGGLKSMIYAKPRDDVNQGTSKWWYVPVRYSNLDEGEPGYCCDLYYADIYKEGGVFDNWDSNGNNIFAEWKGFRKDNLDLYPDVALGRLACRNIFEVKIMVDKIITYEKNTDNSWFEKIIAVSGDGFLDQFDLDIQWDTSSLPEGDYTIFAQSENPQSTKGPIDEIPITIDRSQETKLTFNHDDHLITNLIYPHDPIAEIVSVSDGDILGNTDFTYIPPGGLAYLNSQLHWADIEYTDEVLHIRGKTYDPKPYGYTTDLKVWVKNSNGDIVFQDERLDSQTYFEGEWTTGEQLLRGRGGGLYYMPNNFDKELLWTSNGKWTDQSQVISEISQGAGFVFFSGHGSPGWWGNHYPGIPGNRKLGETEGLLVFDVNGPPYLPMEKLTNEYKTPIVVVGGCHNSDFNVSLIPSILDQKNELWTHCYGNPTPECWSWYLTSLSKRGAIACMGNTGYGYGILNEYCTTGGLDNWITTEFFRQYGVEGQDILGDTYAQSITSYINHFKTVGDPDFPWDEGHEKTVQQWVLHGDPSLKIGGYSEQTDISIYTSGSSSDADGCPNEQINIHSKINNQPITCSWDLDGDGEYDDAIGSNIMESWNKPGVYSVSVKTNYQNQEITRDTIIDIEKDKSPNTPSKPLGPNNIKTGQKVTFKTSSTDPYDEEITYLFVWGDGTYDVIGPVPSGEIATANHKWTAKGRFEIKVKAFDNFGKFSDWSEPTVITLAKNKNINQPAIMQFLQNILEKYPNAFPMLRQIFGL